MSQAGAPAGAGPLTVIAAAGPVPLYVAEAAAAAGRAVFVIAVGGSTDQRLTKFPHEMLSWGQLGRMLELLAVHQTQEVVLIGSVAQRPHFSDLRPDSGALRVLPRIVSLLAAGDDTVLSGLVKLIEERGYRVRGAHEIAADLTAGPGPIGGPKPSASIQADVRLALRAARLIGTLDSGQAAVVVQSRVIALEGAEGTDAMIRRVADLRRAKRVRWSGRSGVLAKCSKPQQDLRVDMPTIGPQTVQAVAEAGLAGIVIESRRVIIVARDETVAAARHTGTFVIAAEDGDDSTQGSR